MTELFREKLRNLSDYSGLKSPGLTCYLNSVLQVLFMTEDFREAVKRCCDQDSATIDPHLAKLFSELEKCAAKTHDITQKLGITDVYEQRDAAEYLEKILCLTSPEASKIFKGRLSHKIKCSRCEEGSVSESGFWILPVSVEGCCVKKGLEAFCRGEKFSGDNKMYCDGCNKKRDATLECEVTQNPEILTLLLKRFSFDHKRRRYVKLNCSVKVPQTLQTEMFKNCTYDLYALVHHFGHLQGGHYTAQIKSYENSQWYDFNDTIVEKVHDPPFGAGNSSVRSQTAYLLMYRKVNTLQSERPAEGNQEVSVLNSSVAKERYDLTETGEDLVHHNKLGNDSFHKERNLQKKRQCQAVACVWPCEEELPDRDTVRTLTDAYRREKDFNLETQKPQSNVQKVLKQTVERMSSDAEYLREFAPLRSYEEQIYTENGHQHHTCLKEDMCHFNTRWSPVTRFVKHPADSMAGPKRLNPNMISLETQDDSGTNTETMSSAARSVTDGFSRTKLRNKIEAGNLSNFCQISTRNSKNLDTMTESFRRDCTSVACVKSNDVMRDQRKNRVQTASQGRTWEHTLRETEPGSLKEKKAARNKVQQKKPVWK
ncbi:hypothetical protein LDENG_00175560 [Lucifuga dentata]|nr:hypothetical protein LDENG_00175560 [Lucifuga dentata]